MCNTDNELKSLLHTFAQPAYRTFPPLIHTETIKPPTRGLLGFAVRKTFQPKQVYSLLTGTHLTVKSTLLRQIADMAHIVVCQSMATEKHRAVIWPEQASDYTQQGSLASSVGTKQSHSLACIHCERHITQHLPSSESLADMFRLKYHKSNLHFKQCHLSP